MTLGGALEEAFGRTDCVRRNAWPAGSVGVIDCLPEDPLKPFSCTLGRTRRISERPSDVERKASDWYPCDVRGEQATDNWHTIFAAGDDGQGSIGRGDQCEVWLDGRALEGGCTLAWVKPHELSVRVLRERIAAWPEEGMMFRQLSISANGLVREFWLLGVKWQSHHDEARLYHLYVAERGDSH